MLLLAYPLLTLWILVTGGYAGGDGTLLTAVMSTVIAGAVVSVFVFRHLLQRDEKKRKQIAKKLSETDPTSDKFEDVFKEAFEAHDLYATGLPALLPISSTARTTQHVHVHVYMCMSSQASAPLQSAATSRLGDCAVTLRAGSTARSCARCSRLSSARCVPDRSLRRLKPPPRSWLRPSRRQTFLCRALHGGAWCVQTVVHVRVRPAGGV